MKNLSWRAWRSKGFYWKFEIYIYKNIDEYNSNRKRKVLIVFNVIIADLIGNNYSNQQSYRQRLLILYVFSLGCTRQCFYRYRFRIFNKSLSIFMLFKTNFSYILIIWILKNNINIINNILIIIVLLFIRLSIGYLIKIWFIHFLCLWYYFLLLKVNYFHCVLSWLFTKLFNATFIFVYMMLIF